MHQSEQLRAHSMQTVQFSSFRAMTPRARMVGVSFSFGYCVVTPGFSMLLSVTPKPLTSPCPGMFGIRRPPSEDHLENSCDEDVEEGQRDEELPGDGL